MCELVLIGLECPKASAPFAALCRVFGASQLVRNPSLLHEVLPEEQKVPKMRTMKLSCSQVAHSPANLETNKIPNNNLTSLVTTSFLLVVIRELLVAMRLPLLLVASCLFIPSQKCQPSCEYVGAEARRYSRCSLSNAMASMKSQSSALTPALAVVTRASLLVARVLLS